MKVFSFQIVIWAMVAGIMAAPIREQAPIGDEKLARAIEQVDDPELADFAYRLQTATAGSSLQTGRLSLGSSAAEAKGPEKHLEQGEGSCFCSGGSVCCRQGGDAIDCGFGLCGI